MNAVFAESRKMAGKVADKDISVRPVDIVFNTKRGRRYSDPISGMNILMASKLSLNSEKNTGTLLGGCGTN